MAWCAFAIALLVGCKREAGGICYAAADCGEDLACVGEGVRRCEPCADLETCLASGKCTASAGFCVAATDGDCAGSALCKNNGACTAKSNACVVGGDADCQKSEACTGRGFCKASGNNCVRPEPTAG